MVAVRTGNVTAGAGSFGAVAGGDEIRSGDVVLGFFSGDRDIPTVSGGAWTTLKLVPGTVNEWGGTRVAAHVVTGDEEIYGIDQDALGDAAVGFMVLRNTSISSITVLPANTGTNTQPTLPLADPPAAGVIIARWAAGVPIPGTLVSWALAATDEPIGTAQSGTHATGALTYYTSTSTARYPAADWSVFPVLLRRWHGITVMIGTSGGIIPPDPPEIPPWAPGQGSTPWRYTAHRIGGEYLTDVYPFGLRPDSRIDEAGAVSFNLPVPNPGVAAELRRAFPRERSTRDRGAGAITFRAWRDGNIWDEWWMTGYRLSQDGRGHPTFQVRASGLEAYLRQVTIEDDLFYSDDEIAAARSLLAHLAAQPNCDIGLLLLGGTSGISRDLSVLAADNKRYGDALRAFARVSGIGGFEWRIQPVVTAGVYQRYWQWGAPLEGVNHTFTQGPGGGDIAAWSEDVDALRGGTRLRVRGGTPEQEDATETATPVYSDFIEATEFLAAGHLRISREVDHPLDAIDSDTVNAYGRRYMQRLGGTVWTRNVKVVLGAESNLSPQSIGGTVKLLMSNEWYEIGATAGLDADERLIGITVTPAAREADGRDMADLTLAGPDEDVT